MQLSRRNKQHIWPAVHQLPGDYTDGQEETRQAPQETQAAHRTG
jgi:hypothetical protein